MSTVRRKPQLNKVLDDLQRRVQRAEQASTSSNVDAPPITHFPQGITIGDAGHPITPLLPDTPTGLSVTPGAFMSDVFVDVTWDEPDEQVAYEFEIQLNKWNPSSNEWEVNQFRRAFGNTVRFEGLLPNTLYRVRVLTVSGIGFLSAPTDWEEFNSVSDTTLPEQVTGVQLSIGINSMVVRWNEVSDPDVINGNGQYEVQVDTNSNFSSATTQLAGGTITSFTDLEHDTEYFVRVRAVDASGNAGPWSDTKSITTNKSIGEQLLDPEAFPVRVRDQLPNLPDSSYPVGTVISLRSDGKLYRNYNQEWVVSVDTSDLQGTVITEQIAQDAITAAQIAANAVTEAKIAAAAITAEKIAELAIGEVHLQDLAVSADKVAASAITTAKIANQAVEAGKLAANAVGESHLQDLAVSAGKLQDASVTLDKFASGLRPIQVVASLPTLPDPEFTVDSVVSFDSKLYRNDNNQWTAAVPSSDIDGQITETQISDDAISTPKIQANAINADKIAANAVTANEIAGNTITAAEISAGAVTADELAANSVIAVKIAAGAVVSEKIDAEAVTAEKILAGAITTVKLDAQAVTAAKIAAGAVEAEKIAAGAITAEKIDALAVTTEKIDAGAITAEKILAGAITALHIQTDAIQAAHIESGSIDTAHISAIGLHADVITAGLIGAERIYIGPLTNFEEGWDPSEANQQIGLWAFEDTTWIDGGNIFTNTITANQIAANAILSEHIQADQILAGHILAGEIKTEHLEADAITTALIDAGAVTADEIDANAIRAHHILAGEIETDHLDAGIINSDHIVTAGLDAAVISFGTMSGDRIEANTLDVNSLKTSTLSSGEITISASGSIRVGSGSPGLFLDSQGIRLFDNGGATSVHLNATNGQATFLGEIVSGSHIQGATIAASTVTGQLTTGPNEADITLGEFSGSTYREIRWADNLASHRVILRPEFSHVVPRFFVSRRIEATALTTNTNITIGDSAESGGTTVSAASFSWNSSSSSLGRFDFRNYDTAATDLILYRLGSSSIYELNKKPMGSIIDELHQKMGTDFLIGRGTSSTRVAFTTSTGNILRNIEAASLYTGSSVTLKKNIEPADAGYLDKVLNVPVYRYHREMPDEELENIPASQKHQHKDDQESPVEIGLLVEESDYENIDSERGEVNVNTTLFMLWQAVRELAAIVKSIPGAHASNIPEPKAPMSSQKASEMKESLKPERRMSSAGPAIEWTSEEVEGMAELLRDAEVAEENYNIIETMESMVSVLARDLSEVDREEEPEAWRRMNKDAEEASSIINDLIGDQDAAEHG